VLGGVVGILFDSTGGVSASGEDELNTEGYKHEKEGAIGFHRDQLAASAPRSPWGGDILWRGAPHAIAQDFL
jgi:hypothetical protein